MGTAISWAPAAENGPKVPLIDLFHLTADFPVFSLAESCRHTVVFEWPASGARSFKFGE